MILKRLTIGDATTKLEKKKLFLRGKKLPSFAYNLYPLKDKRWQPMSIISDVADTEGTKIILDVFGKAKVEAAETNEEDLAFVSFNKADEQVVGIQVTEITRTLHYDYDKAGRFNVILGISGDGEVLTVTTKETKNKTKGSTFNTYTVMKDGVTLSVVTSTMSRREERKGQPYELNYFPAIPPLYTKLILKRSESHIGDDITTAVNDIHVDGYIKTLTIDSARNESVADITKRLNDMDDLECVFYVDQSDDVKTAIATYLGEDSDIPAYNCVCYTNGRKELVKI